MKDIEGFEGLYAVTADGKVWSYRKQKFMKAADNGHGYLHVELTDATGKKFKKRINRLVAETYIPNPEGLTDVGHKDNCRTNNSVENLEWVTRKENCNNEGGKRRGGKRTPIRCVETGEIFANQTEAAKFIGTSAYNVSNCITGKQKTAGGYHWERIEK